MMTENEKSILLKDLSARLPYGVMCDIGLDHPLPLQMIFVDRFDVILLDFYGDDKDYQVYLSEVKPYLRPLSSMTKEERSDMGKAISKDRIKPWGEIKTSGVDNLLLSSSRQASNLIDWFNEHHFDYRGLIEKGLALEAPEGMYTSNKEE